MLTLTFGSYTIADGVTTRLTGALTVNLQHAIQDGTPIGAAAALFFDRLTQTQRVSFTVLRQNSADQGIARRVWQQLIGIRALSGKANLVLTLTVGTTVHRFTCVGAAKPGIETTGDMPTDVVTYHFETPAWTYTTTTAEDSAALDMVDGSEERGIAFPCDGGSCADTVRLPIIDGSSRIYA